MYSFKSECIRIATKPWEILGMEPTQVFVLII